jgi:3-hydroxyisobutyrate dehydrogenase-like beta-hydroxyacid dehydrogenase
MTLTIIGFGEAGQAIAEGLLSGSNPPSIACFDIKTFDPGEAVGIEQVAERLGVCNTGSLSEALAGAEFIISTVTAGSALDVAHAIAALKPEARAFFDMNSVAPSTKQTEAGVLEAVGVAYIDTAVMAPIHPRLHRTPMLLAGPQAEALGHVLADWGMDARVVGAEVGRASSIKMLRSVMVKGLEALTAEMGLAAVRAGVKDEVIASLNASFPGIDWEERTAYNLERMTTHGVRRAEEMEEVVQTLTDLGVEAELTAGTVRRQRRFGASGVILDDETQSLEQRAAAIFAKLTSI